MQTVARDDVVINRSGASDGRWYRVTNYFGDSLSSGAGPQGFLIEMGPEAPGAELRYTVVPPHFHLVRQFQVVIGGDEPTIGKRMAPPITFHYADPSTPYGPIDSGPGGVAFFTLRPRGDTHAHWMPGSRAEMLRRAGRNIVRTLGGDEEARRAVAPADPEILIEPHDDGLASFRQVLGPNASATGPAPTGSGGQYYLVTQGSLVVDGRDLSELSLLWTAADGPAPVLIAGAAGCRVLILQFPHDGARPERA